MDDLSHQLTEKYINDWKRSWVVEHSRNSQHPAEFWQEVAELLLEGRLLMKNNPLTPIGYYVFEWPGAMEYLVERNNRGIELEKEGKIEAAIVIYEMSISDAFFGTHPYDRLRIIYGRRHWYKDAVRVCRAYLDLPDRPHGQDKLHFKHYLEKLLVKI
jgi:hypothetical protein